MKQFLFTVCFSVFTMFTVTAQEAIVKGRIVDTNSSDPIQGVQIRILESVFSSETNSKGLFAFKDTGLPQGEQVLIVSKSGYNTQQIQVVIQDSSPINLDPILLELDLLAQVM